MDPLSITASLIAVLQVSGAVISTLYEYRTSVKAAPADAARIISDLNGLRGVLESLLQALEKEARNVGQDGGGGGDGSGSGSGSGSGGAGSGSRLATFQTLAEPGGELDCCKADLETVYLKLGGDEAGSASGWKKVRRALEWPFKEKDVEKLLQSVQRAKSTMLLALSTDQTALTLEIHEGVGNLTKQFAASSLDERKRRVTNWLAAPDAFANHLAARKKRQPMTGDWFLRGELYGTWRSSPKSFLWLYGIPGSGKSILCSSIIEDLLSRPKDAPFAVAFYYFDFNDAGNRDVMSLIRALAVQLLNGVPSTAKYLEVLSSQVDKKPLDMEPLLEIFKTLIQELGETYLVIDALDECEECEGVLNFLEKTQGLGFDSLHILVASRQLPEIEDIIADCATSSICLQNVVNQDISILIQSRLSSDRKFQKWPHQVRSEIEDALTGGASGMIRWVVCQLDMLRNCVTLPALRKALKSLPKTLDETYERILMNIDESYVSDVQKVLQFLTFSPRPMKLPELVEVLAIDLDGEEPYFNPENRIPDPKDIITMCSTLATSGDLSQFHIPDNAVRAPTTLRLAHFSVKEYLLSERIKTSKVSMFSMDPVSGNLFIAKTYVTYLLGAQFSQGHCGWKNLEFRYRDWPLFRSALSLWPMHIGMVDDHVDASTKAFVQKLFSTRRNSMGGNYAAWVGGLIPEADTFTIISTPPLYYAASFGMISIVKLLLSDMPKSKIDIKGGRAKSTPLHVACFRGQVQAVKLLLEAGADPNSTNKVGESCLYWVQDVEVKEYREINQMLLKYGAEDERLRPSAKFIENTEGPHGWLQRAPILEGVEETAPHEEQHPLAVPEDVLSQRRIHVTEDGDVKDFFECSIVPKKTNPESASQGDKSLP